MQRFRLPGLVDVIEKGRRSQDHEEDSAHVFKGLDAQVFDIHARFLVETLGMLNLGAAAPGDKYGLGFRRRLDRAISEQTNVPIQVRVMNRQ